MPRRTRVGECVYCGANGPVTRDHVPPRCLFPPEARVNLITVDACPACNDGFKRDDEYFRITLSIRDDLPEGPEATFLRHQTKRTLHDPAARSFRNAIRAATTRIARHTPGGIYLGHATALRIDAARVTRTAERIVRGLHGKFFGRSLPKSHEVSVALLDLQRDDSALKSPEIQELLMLLGQNGKHRGFGRVLDIWYAKADDDSDSSFWVVRLHSAFGFLGFAVPRDA